MQSNPIKTNISTEPRLIQQQMHSLQLFVSIHSITCELAATNVALIHNQIFQSRFRLVFDKVNATGGEVLEQTKNEEAGAL